MSACDGQLTQGTGADRTRCICGRRRPEARLGFDLRSRSEVASPVAPPSEVRKFRMFRWLPGRIQPGPYLSVERLRSAIWGSSMHRKTVRRALSGRHNAGWGYRSHSTARRSVRSGQARLSEVSVLPRSKTMTLTLVLAIGLVLIAGPWANPAHAGTYVMRNCNVPGHANSLLHPWQVSQPLDTSVSAVDGCATGNGLAARVGEPRELANGDGLPVVIAKPTGARGGITFVKLVVWYAARLAGSGQPLQFTTQERRLDDSLHLGLFNAPPGSESIVAEHMLHPETNSVQMVFRCGPWGVPQPGACFPTHAVPFLFRGMEVTLREDIPPLLLPPTGTLLEPGPQSGVRSLVFSASDAQSGLRTIDVLLGDTVVASQDLTPLCPHADFTVCPPSEDGTLHVDTRGVANGAHRLTVRARDAAGNERVVHRETPVEVANVPNSLPPVNAPATAPSSDVPRYRLSARFKGTSRSTLTVPHGGRVSIRGRLTLGSRPIAAGTRIEVLERSDRRGAREVRRARVKTKGNGSFSAILATTRPSRRIRVAYRPTGGGGAVSPSLRLRVRAASRLRASLRGRTVRFSGRVLSRPIPKAGKRVMMEGRAPGSAWTVFKSLRTDRKGRFSGTYRLRVRRPGVTLNVRALVRSEGGYGYLGSRSRAVTLTVR